MKLVFEGSSGELAFLTKELMQLQNTSAMARALAGTSKAKRRLDGFAKDSEAQEVIIVEED